MKRIERGMILIVNLDPTLGSETGKTRPCIVVTNNTYNERVPVIQVIPVTEWNEKKAQIVTNVEIAPDGQNGLTKISIADCLQTRPVDVKNRLVAIRGKLSPEIMSQIDQALKIVFALD